MVPELSVLDFQVLNGFGCHAFCRSIAWLRFWAFFIID